MTQPTEQFPDVRGLCPMGCGRTLFLASGRHVTCSLDVCPDPSRADYELNLPMHLRIDREKVHETILSQAARIAELAAFDVSMACEKCDGEDTDPPCSPCEGTGYIAHHQWRGPVIAGPPPDLAVKDGAT